MHFTGMILFARPSAIEGLSRIVDFGGTLNEYNSSPTIEQADYLAIEADWRAVGDAIRKVAEENAADRARDNREE